MLNKIKLWNFGTFYLWLFVVKVLLIAVPSPINGYKIANKVGGDGPLLMQPYPYRPADLWHDARSGIDFKYLPDWQTYTQDKQQQQQQEQQLSYPVGSWDDLSSLVIPAKSQSGSDVWQLNDNDVEKYDDNNDDGYNDGAVLLQQHRPEGYHPQRTSSEIDFEPLSNFNMNLVKNAIWLSTPASSSASSAGMLPKNFMAHKVNNNKPEPKQQLKQQQQQQLLEHLQLPLQPQRLIFRPLAAETWANIRYGKNINPNMLMTKHFNEPISTTSFLEQLRREDKRSHAYDDNMAHDRENIHDEEQKNENDIFIEANRNGLNFENHKNLENHFVNDKDTVMDDDVNDASEMQDDVSATKDNDSKANKSSVNELNSMPSNVLANPMKKSQTHKNEGKKFYNDGEKFTELQLNKLMLNNDKRARDKKKPKTLGSTPFLPAVSGGAMTNLGKFFRDLSKNVQFSEKYQWTSEEQKLMEGDPNLGNLHHHLTEPHLKTDQAGEWIKAIRFYRPSQKIRSLVAMNPHGQWAHGSQFLDPNYMWVGLGK